MPPNVEQRLRIVQRRDRASGPEIEQAIAQARSTLQVVEEDRRHDTDLACDGDDADL
jgi:hypothetical protein